MTLSWQDYSRSTDYYWPWKQSYYATSTGFNSSFDNFWIIQANPILSPPSLCLFFPISSDLVGGTKIQRWSQREMCSECASQVKTIMDEPKQEAKDNYQSKTGNRKRKYLKEARMDEWDDIQGKLRRTLEGLQTKLRATPETNKNQDRSWKQKSI